MGSLKWVIVRGVEHFENDAECVGEFFDRDQAHEFFYGLSDINDGGYISIYSVRG